MITEWNMGMSGGRAKLNRSGVMRKGQRNADPFSLMVRQRGLEPPTVWSEARCSIL